MLEEGWVSVADASKALSAMGDVIDASNVSKYLLRNLDIPQKRVGKYRFVDLAALILHRGGNVQSVSRREVEPPTPPPLGEDTEDEDDAASPPSGITSAIQQANLRIKQLQVREKERDDLLATGDLVPVAEVLAVITEAMQAFITELERVETQIAAQHGRVVAADFRKARKAAQAAAAARLQRAASTFVHPSVIPALKAAQAATP